jgi:transglutaminase-like putative cysteine protease
VSVGRWTLDRATAVRLAAFAVLAALAAAQWTRLVEAPSVGRVALVVAIACAGAVALLAISVARPRREVAWPLAAVAMLVAATAGLVAVGIPLRLLGPGEWGELLDNVGRGFSGLAGDVPYPYARDNEWARLVLLAGLPMALALAAALAFWPRHGERFRRTAPLVVLAAAFGVGATVVAPDLPVLWGLLLLAGIVAWRWLPTLPRRDALAATGLVAAAGALAIPVAGWLDSAEPRLDFRDWELGRGKAATFDWNHSYGPLDWPREGTALAAMNLVDRPQYWRAAVLDEFDGVTWRRPEQSVGERLELPTAVEGGAADGSLARDRKKWIEETAVTIGPMESEFVLSAGAIISIDGLDSALALPNGTTVTGDEPLEEGDDYRVLSYAPDPSVRQLRRAPGEYAPALARYTELTVPARVPAGAGAVGPTPPGSSTNVQLPLRGTAPGAEGRAAREAIAASPYASTYDVARQITRGEPTAHDAARAIEDYLGTGFTYSENPEPHRYPLRSFLFGERIGYCQQFSGAMALMLRMNGIPSRVVSGFSPGTADSDADDRYLVADRDAHSWVEAYFTGIGWVTFDPTPSAAPATGRAESAGLATVGSALDTGGASDSRRKGFDPGQRDTTPPAGGTAGSGIPAWVVLAGLVVVALIAVAALGAIAAVRRYRYGRLSPEARAKAHLEELPGALARLGWPLERAETLLGLEGRLHRYRKDAAARYVSKLRTTRFSPAPGGAATLADRRALRDTLTRDNGLGSRIRALVALPPGGPGR